VDFYLPGEVGSHLRQLVAEVMARENLQGRVEDRSQSPEGYSLLERQWVLAQEELQAPPQFHLSPPVLAGVAEAGCYPQRLRVDSQPLEEVEAGLAYQGLQVDPHLPRAVVPQRHFPRKLSIDYSKGVI
jgi:hypothetical protein